MDEATNNLRKYGRPPYKVAVIHGGPGAPGEMAPLARHIASFCDLLEPLQTADSLEGHPVQRPAGAGRRTAM